MAGTASQESRTQRPAAATAARETGLNPNSAGFWDNDAREEQAARQRNSWETNKTDRIRKRNRKTQTAAPNTVRELRIALGMTQSQLLKAIGLPPSQQPHWSDIEHGRRPSPEIISQLQTIAANHGHRWSYDDGLSG